MTTKRLKTIFLVTAISGFGIISWVQEKLSLEEECIVAKKDLKPEQTLHDLSIKIYLEAVHTYDTCSKEADADLLTHLQCQSIGLLANEMAKIEKIEREVVNHKMRKMEEACTPH